MQVIFLGTSSGVPTRARNVSAVALRLPQRSEIWLFDCGEGTQHQFLRSDLRLSQLRRAAYPAETRDIQGAHRRASRLRPLTALLPALAEKNAALRRQGEADEMLEEELLAARLYTGPMFQKYNLVCRAANLPGWPYLPPNLHTSDFLPTLAQSCIPLLPRPRRNTLLLQLVPQDSRLHFLDSTVIVADGIHSFTTQYLVRY